LNAQGVCDDRLVFRFFSVRCPSATHDSTAFDVSALGEAILRGHVPGFLFGDGAYGGKRGVLTPYARACTTRQDTFNYVLSSYRQTIERGFEVLVRRWGVLWTPLTRRTEANIKTVLACVFLHNLLQRDSGSVRARLSFDAVWAERFPARRQLDNSDVRSEFLAAYEKAEFVVPYNTLDSKQIRDQIADALHRAGLTRPLRRLRRRE
jgi:hypothetical protein